MSAATKMVPTEPTSDMLAAAEMEAPFIGREAAKAIYRAMLDVAPETGKMERNRELGIYTLDGFRLEPPAKSIAEAEERVARLRRWYNTVQQCPECEFFGGSHDRECPRHV